MGKLIVEVLGKPGLQILFAPADPEWAELLQKPQLDQEEGNAQISLPIHSSQDAPLFSA